MHPRPPYCLCLWSLHRLQCKILCKMLSEYTWEGTTIKEMDELNFVILIVQRRLIFDRSMSQQILDLVWNENSNNK